MEGLSVTTRKIQTCTSFFFLSSRSTRRHDEESGAAVGSESRLHPAGVFTLRHRGRQQQWPVVVSSPCAKDADDDVDDDADALNHATAVLLSCVMEFKPVLAAKPLPVLWREIARYYCLLILSCHF